MIRKRYTSSRLRHRLTLQQETYAADSAGGYSKGWQDVADIWAEVIPVTNASSKLSNVAGREIFFADQVQSEISHRILIRYRNDVNAAMRLVFENRVFNIRQVASIDERNEVMEIMAQEGVAT